MKAVIFDCFGVLYVPVGEDFFASHIPKEHYEEVRTLGHQADLGQIDQDQLIARVAELSHVPTDEVRAKIASGLLRNHALLAFSQSLRPKYKVGLLSNISAGTMDQFFSPKERQAYFDAVVLSSDVGLAKPDTAIFTLLAERLGCDPKDCIMIDDSAVNCNGAIDAGMQAVVYESTEKAIKGINALLQ